MPAIDRKFLMNATTSFSSFDGSGVSYRSGEMEFLGNYLIDRGDAIDNYNVDFLNGLYCIKCTTNYGKDTVTTKLNVGCKLSLKNGYTARDLAVCVEFKATKLVSKAIEELLDMLGLSFAGIAPDGIAPKLYEPLLVGNDTNILQLAGKMAYDLGFFLYMNPTDPSTVYSQKLSKTLGTHLYLDKDIFTIQSNTDLELPPEKIIMTGSLKQLRLTPPGTNSLSVAKGYYLPAPGPIIAQVLDKTKTIATVRSGRTFTVTEKETSAWGGGTTKTTITKYEPKTNQSIVNDDIYKCIPSDEGRILSREIKEWDYRTTVHGTAINSFIDCNDTYEEATGVTSYVFFPSSDLVPKMLKEEKWVYTGPVGPLITFLSAATILPTDISTSRSVTYTSRTRQPLAAVYPDAFHSTFGDNDILSSSPYTFGNGVSLFGTYIETEKIKEDYSEFLYNKWELVKTTHQSFAQVQASYIKTSIAQSTDMFVNDWTGSPATGYSNHRLYLDTVRNALDQEVLVSTDFQENASPPEERSPPEFEVIDKPYVKTYLAASVYSSATDLDGADGTKTKTYQVEYGTPTTADEIAKWIAIKSWGSYKGLSFTVAYSKNMVLPFILMQVGSFGVYYVDNLTHTLSEDNILISGNGLKY